MGKNLLPAIKQINSYECTGCFGCYNACPTNAINMNMSADGFYLPVIIEEKCINCGNCIKHCPVIVNPKVENRNKENAVVYAAWSKDKYTRYVSSSGGVFTEIANFILKDGGIVVGVEWNKDFKSVKHTYIAHKKDINKFQGSKYLQSYVGDIYRKIVEFIDNGKKVLFSGLPCQVAALNTFIKSPNLVTVDLVCHGTPSIKVFRKYLYMLSGSRNITGINFRDKSIKWTKFCIKVEFSNGTNYISPFYHDPYFIGFLKNLYINRACYNCRFCSLPRIGDITLADYWGVPNHLKRDDGVSLVLSNNDKGDGLISKLIEENHIECVYSELNTAIGGNPRLINGYLDIPQNREEFFKDLNKLTFEEIKKKYIDTFNT